MMGNMNAGIHGGGGLSPFSKVECVCSLPSSVLRERAGRGGEEGEAVIEEESQTGDQSRQDGEQSSGESTLLLPTCLFIRATRSFCLCVSRCAVLILSKLSHFSFFYQEVFDFPQC